MIYRLRKLTIHDEKAYFAYQSAWQHEEEMIPRSSNAKEMTFDQYLSMLSMRASGLYQPGVYVPDRTYVLVDEDDHFCGFLNLRLELNDHLLAYDGHIGYGIHPNYRGLGLGKVILKLGLEKAKKHGIHRVLVTCNEENIKSRKVIESCHGVLENKVYKTDGYILRYWIDNP